MNLTGSTKQVLLCICDGMGFSKNREFNAVYSAPTPNLDSIQKEYPFTTLIPGGEEVGLPKGVAGNSEVGHMNLGAGRAVRQDLVRINEAIKNNTLKDMPPLTKMIEKSLQGSKKLHLMTLLSDGGVHAHIDHLKAVLAITRNFSDLKVYLHAFMDGRDTQKTNGIKYIQELTSEEGFVFASMQGRSIGMDRDRRWEKIKSAYETMTGHGEVSTLTPSAYIQVQYDKDIFDEFIEPVLFNKDYSVQSNDAVFFLNFRPDRAKQISLAFCDKNFEHFENKILIENYLCMSPYIDEELPRVPILFNREKIQRTLCEELANKGLKQLKIAETEKYAHVTYFFNGGAEKPFKGEERILVDSPRDVATYDLKPEMSALEVLAKLSKKLEQKDISLYVVNFANPDMVGHTGNFEATMKAMITIDFCIGELKKVCLENDITMLITADHGNADEMVYPDGSANTSHSKADVPFSLIQKKLGNNTVALKDAALMDVAPTILDLLGIEPNSLMTGSPIFK